jgi:small-conductance mechanosensitive channel
MQRKQRILLIGLLVLIAAACIGLVVTRPSAPAVSRPRGWNPAHIRKRDLVDDRPLQTARAMAALAYTRDEHPFARRALSLGDDQVDLAFAIALRDAALHPKQATDQIRAVQQRIKEAEARVNSDQARIDQLLLSKGKTTPEMMQELELIQAQMTLDQEEVADAKQDLVRVGGDIQSTLKQMLDEHVATHNTPFTFPATDPSTESWTLASHIRAWRAFQDKRNRLISAAQEADATASTLSRSHDDLARRVEERRSGKSASGQASAIDAVYQMGEDAKSLADYGKRIQGEQDLSETYRDWAALLASSQRASVHGIVQSILWILLICLAGLGAIQLLGRKQPVPATERKRSRSLHFVARLAIEVVVVMLIVVVIFGAPGQMTTVIGLAGAGLTVALKDFIVAFFGWFALMGKNGIRVGDWVEINGIGGEVVEIGILHTMLLETGQWSDAGHPTGRKVSFVNSFAVEGHYFNFSTAGQWLWDEIDVLVPAGADPYEVVKAVRETVSKATESSARDAEREWQRVARSHALQSFSAEPAINLKPTGTGIQIVVRYITQAHQRYELRGQLYAAIVELLHSRAAKPAASGEKASGSSA